MIKLDARFEPPIDMGVVTRLFTAFKEDMMNIQVHYQIRSFSLLLHSWNLNS